MDPTQPTPTDAAMAFEQIIKAKFSEHIGLYLGPYLVGGVIDCMLWGFMIHQALIWLSSGGEGRWSLKLCVAWITVVATATTFYTIAYLYWLFVLGFSTFTNFADVKRASAYGVMEIITIVAVQLFYTERAYQLNHKRIVIPIAIGLCLIASMVGGIAATVKGLTSPSYTGDSTAAEWFYVWFGATLGADLLITGSIMSRTGWSATDQIINRLLWISFESQFLPTIVGLVLVLLFTLDRGGTLVYGCLIVHPKVYCCAFFAVINSRSSFRRGVTASYNDSSTQKESNSFNHASKGQHQAIQLDQIQVDTQKYHSSEPLPQQRVGLNRHAANLDDAESGHSEKLNDEGTASMIRLTAVSHMG